MRCDGWWNQWEGALGEWLRGQLDQRGIDAPAYGRYVLSLLTRPLRPDDLSPETVSNGKNWDRKYKTKSTPVKIEALKRSAAVQCLLSATDDQGSGIEQLVDELCEKIKEIEDKKGIKRVPQPKASRRERTRTVSPGEMARLYYAAFPALGQSKETVEPPQPRQWPSPPRERRNTFHAPRTTPKYPKGRRDKPKNKGGNKEALPEWVTNEDVWDMEAQDPIKDFIKTLAQDEGYATCDNTIICEELLKSKRLYERDSAPLPTIDTEDNLLSMDWTIEDDCCTPAPPRTPAEEEVIAKFEAKFDRSLEALWSKEQNNNSPDDDYQELPVDFQDLLSSPSDKLFDGSSSPGKPIPLSLTGSIWSNSSDCNPSECAFQNGTPDVFPGAGVFTLDDHHRNVWCNDAGSLRNHDTMEVLYNKLEPLNLRDPDEHTNNMEVSSAFEIMQPIATAYPKWSTGLDLTLTTNSCYEDVLHAVPAATTAIRSLTALNHSMNSSFAEVVPKAVTGIIGDSIKRKHEEFFNFQVVRPIETLVSFVKPDEDLLSARRTHFCPVKPEPFCADSTVPVAVPKVTVVVKPQNESVVNFENGVTFSIDSDWDSLKFTRSSSGSIFLESETDPPTQYMEYRTQGIDYSRLDLSPSLEYFDDGLSASDLTLKFRVCQNEKSVQTCSPDELNGNVLPPSDDLDTRTVNSPDSTICSIDREDKAEEAVDTDSELESLEVNWIQCEKCKMDSNPWVTDNLWQQPNRYNCTKIWSIDESICKACEELRADAKAKRSETQKSLVHKEESAREWDQLLSDITYARSFQGEKDCSDQVDSTPSEDYFLGSKEVTVCASDGNFIRSANLILGNYIKSKGPYYYNAANGKSIIKGGGNIVGCILDRAVNVSGEGMERVGGRGEGGRGGGTRKRRHSAGGGNGGKLRCCPVPPLFPPAPPSCALLPLPLPPLLTRPTLSHVSIGERPLTR